MKRNSRLQVQSMQNIKNNILTAIGEDEEGRSAPKCDGRRIDKRWKTFLFVQDAIQCHFSSNVV